MGQSKGCRMKADLHAVDPAVERMVEAERMIREEVLVDVEPVRQVVEYGQGVHLPHMETGTQGGMEEYGQRANMKPEEEIEDYRRGVSMPPKQPGFNW